MNRIKVYAIDLTINLLLPHILLTNVTPRNSESTNSSILDFIECELLTHDFKHPLEDLLKKLFYNLTAITSL